MTSAHHRRRAWQLGQALVLAGACTGQVTADSPAPKGAPADAPSVDKGLAPERSRASAEFGPPSADARLRLRAEIDRALADKDRDAFMALFDWEEFADRVSEGTAPGAIDRAAIQTGFQNGLWKRTLGDAVPEHGVRFLRERDAHGGTTLLYRIASSTGRFNYVDFILASRRDGSAAIVDMWGMSAGSSSAALRLMMGVLTPSGGGLLGLGAPVSPGVVETMKAVLKAKAEKNPKEVLRLLDSLPAELLDSAPIQAVVLQAAANAGDGERLDRMIAALQARDPSFSSAQFWQITNQFLQGNWDATLTAIEAVDRALGGDLYLDVVRANIMWAAGDESAATKLCRSAVTEDATLRIYVGAGLVDTLD